MSVAELVIAVILAIYAAIGTAVRIHQTPREQEQQQ